MQESRSKPDCYHRSCLVLWSPFAPGSSPFEEQHHSCCLPVVLLSGGCAEQRSCNAGLV